MLLSMSAEPPLQQGKKWLPRAHHVVTQVEMATHPLSFTHWHKSRQLRGVQEVCCFNHVSVAVLVAGILMMPLLHMFMCSLPSNIILAATVSSVRLRSGESDMLGTADIWIKQACVSSVKAASPWVDFQPSLCKDIYYDKDCGPAKIDFWDGWPGQVVEEEEALEEGGEAAEVRVRNEKRSMRRRRMMMMRMVVVGTRIMAVI